MKNPRAAGRGDFFYGVSRQGDYFILMKLSLSLFCLLAALVPLPAAAYVGPGAAIALVGTFFGFTAGVAVAVFFVLAWPALKLYRWHKARKSKE